MERIASVIGLPPENLAEYERLQTSDPTTQEWWAVCGPLRRPVSDRADGEWWKTLPEIFHLD